MLALNYDLSRDTLDLSEKRASDGNVYVVKDEPSPPALGLG